MPKLKKKKSTRPFLKATSLQGTEDTAQDLSTNFRPRKAELNFLFHNTSLMCRQGRSEAPLTHHFSVCQTTLAVLPQPSNMRTEKTGREKAGKDLGGHVNPFTILFQITMSSKPFLLLPLLVLWRTIDKEKQHSGGTKSKETSINIQHVLLDVWIIMCLHYLSPM